jgi:hypothetical protein
MSHNARVAAVLPSNTGMWQRRRTR